MAIRIETVLKIQKLKIEAEEAYAKYQSAVDAVFDKEGESSHAFEIAEDSDRNKFIRLSLTDNIEKLKNGESIVGISMVKPVGVKISLLKNKPRDL